ncbi:hypothetical protein M9980_08905 [Sphingomonas donggukensis]|uniref:Lipoprotein n=1 Tax=Sphingomonas donggukensis TaxID=2949093 RepID=A0ABY4TSB0_9SPHN|nr:hypothetical protein [Sphingomonas donggukensis]URW74695.1 hypothetical protein M9980_08905 [Sphingomonas donggukensis]
MRIAYPILAGLLLAGCAMSAEEASRQAASDARDQAKLDKRLAGYTPGQPQSCIQPYRAQQQEIFGDTLVYRDGRRLYVNKTTGGCFGLRRDDIVVTRSFSGQFCRGDIVRTVDRTNSFPSGTCSFGDFVPYTKDGRG